MNDFVCSCAPLEGVTGYVFRSIHCRMFPGVDRYYAPFLTPRSQKSLKKRERNDVHPDHNQGLRLIPQILTDDAELFLSAAQALGELGYEEVNLNLGCPSGTVVAKGRGSGFLARQVELERFLDQIFDRCPLTVSVKTRVGVDYEEEWSELLPLFNRYPMKELIVHPRLRRDYYKGPVRLHLFEQAVKESRNPLVYNGDLFTTGDIHRFSQRFPEQREIMLGRGLVTNPALVRELEGGAPLQKAELRSFHDELLGAYQDYLSGERPLLFKMKEMWAFWLALFPQAGKSAKLLRKCKTLSDYRTAVSGIFAGDLVLAE
jgi:tRNA-dihydrouridine synthase